MIIRWKLLFLNAILYSKKTLRKINVLSWAVKNLCRYFYKYDSMEIFLLSLQSCTPITCLSDLQHMQLDITFWLACRSRGDEAFTVQQLSAIISYSCHSVAPAKAVSGHAVWKPAFKIQFISSYIRVIAVIQTIFNNIRNGYSCKIITTFIFLTNKQKKETLI